LAEVNWFVIITATPVHEPLKGLSNCRNSLAADDVRWRLKELSRSCYMPEQMTSSVEALEAKAEKILAEAKTRAGDIVLEAKEEAKKMLSSQLPLDEVKTESEKIVNKAQAEADTKIKDAEKSAAEIKASADKRVKEITELVVNIVKGKS
jgi:vacuolar-type H+-ATPase subunit H